MALKEGKLCGTLCCSHEMAGDPRECSLGFFECIDDFEVATELFRQAERWARQHGLSLLCGTYNLDREDARGVLLEGRDRPPVILCGHNPPHYGRLFERGGFVKRHDDGLAYSCILDERSPQFQRLYRLADRVRQRRQFTIRSANLENLEEEMDRILELQNQALAHLDGVVPYDRAAIEGMVLPLKDAADPDLVLFAEVDGRSVGWFPAIPNFNEILIHLGGLRRPWDYLNAIRYRGLKPKCLAIKSVAVLPEYWDTGVAALLFAEMARRAVAKGFQWLDLSLTGEDNPDTADLAHHMGAKVYKRYRFYKKELESRSPGS
jgi:GNAT superfamily N-acetyltransferase